MESFIRCLTVCVQKYGGGIFFGTVMLSAVLISPCHLLTDKLLRRKIHNFL